MPSPWVRRAYRQDRLREVACAGSHRRAQLQRAGQEIEGRCRECGQTFDRAEMIGELRMNVPRHTRLFDGVEP